MGVNLCNKIGIDQSEFEIESSIINSIANEVLNPISFLSNKDIINVLLRKISSECDLVRKDIYRCALELVVEKTPDDL
ncbi:TPA: biofilm/acid-resistance regulator YmgB/AriR [Shigella flexneri]